MQLPITDNNRKNLLIKIKRELEDVLIKYKEITYALFKVVAKAMELKDPWLNILNTNTLNLKVIIFFLKLNVKHNHLKSKEN